MTLLSRNLNNSAALTLQHYSLVSHSELETTSLKEFTSRITLYVTLLIYIHNLLDDLLHYFTIYHYCYHLEIVHWQTDLEIHCSPCATILHIIHCFEQLEVVNHPDHDYVLPEIIWLIMILVSWSVVPGWRGWQQDCLVSGSRDLLRVGEASSHYTPGLSCAASPSRSRLQPRGCCRCRSSHQRRPAWAWSVCSDLRWSQCWEDLLRAQSQWQRHEIGSKYL